MDFLTGLMELRRMCNNTHSCTECPQNVVAECRVASTFAHYTDERVKGIADAVEKWSAEHPVKTMEDAFFEAFPSPKRYENGCLFTCPDELVPTWGALCRPGIRAKDPEKCKKCWRRPVP